jgi:hypothetical protein
MSYSIDDNDFRPRPPLAGGHQIALLMIHTQKIILVAVVVVVVAMEWVVNIEEE